MSRRTLLDMLARDIAADPGDAEPVDVQAAADAQDLGYELAWADAALDEDCVHLIHTHTTKEQP